MPSATSRFRRHSGCRCRVGSRPPRESRVKQFRAAHLAGSVVVGPTDESARRGLDGAVADLLPRGVGHRYAALSFIRHGLVGTVPPAPSWRAARPPGESGGASYFAPKKGMTSGRAVSDRSPVCAVSPLSQSFPASRRFPPVWEGRFGHVGSDWEQRGSLRGEGELWVTRWPGRRRAGIV